MENFPRDYPLLFVADPGAKMMCYLTTLTTSISCLAFNLTDSM